ncbi:hypothetical protein KIPB_012671, partial [Kipferlia bialata]
QRAFDARRKRDIDALKAEAESSHEFKPKLVAKRPQSACARPPRDRNQGVHERLFDEHQRQRRRRESRDEAENHRHTFQPHLNKNSRMMGRKSSLGELVENPRAKAVQERSRQAVIAREAEECTFQPKILTKKRGRAVSSRYAGNADAVSAHIELERKSHQAKVERMKKQREYNEIQKCTFTPRVRHVSRTAEADTVVVRGLGRHLELMEMARKKEREQDEREQSLTRPKQRSRGDVSTPYTVPEPFKLSSDPGTQRKKQDIRYMPHVSC